MAKANTTDLLPTPPIGFNVVYHVRGDEKSTAPAFVGAQESPGYVELIVFPSTTPIKRMAVQWHGSAEKGSPSVLQHGTWSYVDGVRPPTSHFTLHQEEIERREKKKKQAAIEQKQIEEEYKRRQEQQQSNIGQYDVARVQAEVLAHQQ